MLFRPSKMSRRAPAPASLKDLLRRRIAEHDSRPLFGRWADAGGVEAWTSYDQLDASARRIASSGIACPNETVAVLMKPPQEQSGAWPPLASNCARMSAIS